MEHNVTFVVSLSLSFFFPPTVERHSAWSSPLGYGLTHLGIYDKPRILNMTFDSRSPDVLFNLGKYGFTLTNSQDCGPCETCKIGQDVSLGFLFCL